MKVRSHGAQGSCPRRPEIKCPFDRHLMVVILPQLSSHGRWFFNTECPAFVLLTHDAPLMTTHSRGFHPSKNLPAFSSACFPYLPSRLLAAGHMCANLLQEPPHLVPHLELPFPGPAEPFPAVISDSGRAEQLPPRKPSRRQPSPSSPPPELSSWSRAVPPCLRASAVPPVAPLGAPHLGEPRPAAFATERSSSMSV